MKIVTSSSDETAEFGKQFGKSLPAKSVVCFFGNLAAGKTTFIKGLVEGAANYSPDQVSSPTFVYLHIYTGSSTVYHFDLYRLKGIDEFISMGFDELFDQDGICCIEWSERIKEILPASSIRVELKALGESVREISIT